MNISKLSKLIDQSDYVNDCGMDGFNLQRRLYYLAKSEAGKDGDIPMKHILTIFSESWDEKPLEILTDYIAMHGEGETLSAFAQQESHAYSTLYEKMAAAYGEYAREIADVAEAALQAILDRGESVDDGD